MHPKTQLEMILSSLPNPSLSGYFYRSVDHSSLYSIDPPDALYSLGPGKSGQRYTPFGGPPALYVADKSVTAFAEGTHAITSSLAGTIVPPAPVVVYAVDVNLEHVLLLTDNDILNALGTTISELQGPWADQVDTGVDVPTHILADAVFKTRRYQGMLFHSKENKSGTNLIIWTNYVCLPAYVEVFDPTGKLAACIPKRTL